MPKDWQGNVRYLLKLLFRWRLNCTEIAQASDRRAVFSNHSPQTNTYCQLAEGALSSRCLRLCISTLYRKCFPHLRAHQKPHFSTLLSFTKSVVKKNEENVSFPRTPRMSSWDPFTIHTHLLHNLRGFSSKQQGFHLKRPTYFFSAPSTWRHSISPNFFYKPNTARNPKTSTYKPPYRNDKNSVLPFTKAIMLPGQAILPQRWAGFPSQPTLISEGIKTLRDIANTAYSFFSHVTSESSDQHTLVVRKDGSHPRSFPYFPTAFREKQSIFRQKLSCFSTLSSRLFLFLPVCRTR